MVLQFKRQNCRFMCKNEQAAHLGGLLLSYDQNFTLRTRNSSIYDRCDGRVGSDVVDCDLQQVIARL